MDLDSTLTILADGTRAIGRASTPAHVFKALLEASRAVSARAAVFLVRQGTVSGWGSFGYASEVATCLRSHREPAVGGFIGEVTGPANGTPCVRPADSTELDFGQSPMEETVACAVRIEGCPVAILLAERAPGSAWSIAGLGLLCAVAELRLELGLARRRAEGRAEAATGAAVEAPAVAVPVAAAAAVAAAAGAGASRAAEPQANPQIEAARRYARLVATDIRLYNEEAVVLGRRNGDLMSRLAEHLARGKETFMRRHGDLGPTGIEVLRDAYVQVLAAGDETLIPAGPIE